MDDCKSHGGADVQVEEQVAHQLWAQPEFYLPILVSPFVCLYKIAAFKVGMALITRQAGFLLLVAFHITYSCPCLVVQYTEELISRTFLGEIQF